MHQGRKDRLSRRARIARRPFKTSTLGIEALEQRRLLHAGLELETLDLGELFLESEPNPNLAPVTAAVHPLSEIPALSSFPGAPATLYLDFDGHHEDTWGSYSDIDTPVWSTDGDLTTFSDTELAAIQNIWSRVAEDYAPFKVNVTTVLPPSFANKVAMRVSIGGAGDWTGGNYGGIGYVNSFTNSVVNTVYVFPSHLGNSSKNIAEASSHEAGHSFGLQHQSAYDANGVLTQDYYTGANGRAPIMGNSYSATRGLWWNGTSTSSTTIQDDMTVISRSTNGFGYRTDDHGNTAGTATPLSGSGTTLSGSGVITQTSDVDYFSFDTAAGQVSLSATVPASINNLDAKLELRDAAGNLITSAAPTNSFNATITTTLAAGSYRLVVASQGSYGDVGQYTVSANVVAASTIPHEVLARSVFYNASAFDGNNVAINVADDAAIDTSKVAYRPGDGPSQIANVTSYTRGINGIIVDLAGTHGTLSLSDFTFKMSAQGLDANSSPGSWTAAPAPTFAVRSGAGTSGSDRLEFVWANGAITDRWLEVIVEGNDASGGFNTNTGLSTSDVFFFGNKVGESFTTFATDQTYTVDSFDEIATRFNQGSGADPSFITNRFDFNRDLTVDSSDQIIARFNQGFLSSIDIGGAAGGSVAGAGDGGDANAVAAALSSLEPDNGAPVLAAASLSSASERLEISPPVARQSVAAVSAAEVRALALDEVAAELSEIGLDDELLERIVLRV